MTPEPTPRPQTFTRDLEDTRRALEAWLAARRPDARSVRIPQLDIPATNGMSTETLLFDAVFDALGDAALDNVLVIDGDSGDTLTLSNGWTKTATVASHDVYTTTTGNIQVAIDTDIVVTVS